MQYAAGKDLLLTNYDFALPLLRLIHVELLKNLPLFECAVVSLY